MTQLAFPSGLRTEPSGVRLGDLREALEVEQVIGFGPGAAEREPTGLSVDSRTVREGTVFFAVPGVNDDGSRYVDEALDRGAIAIVSERPLHVPVPVLVVRSARRAVAVAARVFHRDPSRNMQIAGVTGTNGKTTVTHLVRHILELDGRSTGLLGTIGHEFCGRVLPANNTTPAAIELQGYLREMADRGTRDCVMEVSSHALVQDRVHGVKLRVGAFLNLSPEHLDYHGSMDEYGRAKARLMQQLEPGAVAVLNLDSSFASWMAGEVPAGIDVLTFGLNPDADIRATVVSQGLDGTQLELHMPRGSVDLKLPLPGRYNVENALAAAAICYAMGCSELTIAHGLETAPSVRGRMESVGQRAGVRVWIDYAHTPDAVDKACRTIRSLGGGRLTVVFGCGGDRDRAKRPLMAKAAARHADRLFLTTDNPRSEDPSEIIDQMTSGLDPSVAEDGVEWAKCLDRGTAIEEAVRTAVPGEVVLIAGKGHENYQIYGDTIVPFDDRKHGRKGLRMLGVDSLPRSTKAGREVASGAEVASGVPGGPSARDAV
ncbi:MAG: UDP-N-acetylmuramoyl-L-alanyl-D-glutamate--2,6-diaminopimelate ligase [Planctomycetota bacterium]